MEIINEILGRLSTHINSNLHTDHDISHALSDAHALAQYFGDREVWKFRKELAGYEDPDNENCEFPTYRLIEVIYKKSKKNEPDFDSERQERLIYDSISELRKLKKKAEIDKNEVVKHYIDEYPYFIELKTINMVITNIKAGVKKYFLEVAKKHNIIIKHSPKYEDSLLKLINNTAIQKRLEESWKCFQFNCYEAGAVLLRKVLEMSLHIIIRIKEGNDDSLFDINNGKRQSRILSNKIDIIQSKGLLSLYLAGQIKNLTKFYGDLSAHDYNVTISKEDFLNANTALKMALEHMFTKAKERL